MNLFWVVGFYVWRLSAVLTLPDCVPVRSLSFCLPSREYVPVYVSTPLLSFRPGGMEELSLYSEFFTDSV